MSVTQRFYPNFFLNALSNDALLVFENATPCRIALFNENATFNVEHETVSDVGTINILIGSAKNIDVNTYRNGNVMYFEVPEVSWSELPNEQFQHAIIYRTTGKVESILLMHLDLGSPQLPINGEFTLILDDVCIPNIDFSYEVCE